MSIIGRLKPACISCGFDSVHVKLNPGQLPRAYCPECGLLTRAMNVRQAAGMLANMRPEGGSNGAIPAPPVAKNPIVLPGGGGGVLPITRRAGGLKVTP